MQENDQLDRSWMATKKVASSRNMSKNQLEKEVSRLRRLLEEERDRNNSEILSAAIQAEFSDSHSSLVKQISELKAHHSENQDVIANLRIKLRQYSMKVVK